MVFLMIVLGGVIVRYPVWELNHPRLRLREYGCDLNFQSRVVGSMLLIPELLRVDMS